jgi:hypothetical protein
VVEKPLKPVCQNFGDNNVINNIRDTDRFVMNLMINQERTQLFWNQSNKSVILFIQ